ncbi:22291_t:CDS:2, partial [Racocetra persica]
ESECIPLVYIQNDDEFREINYKSQWLFDNPLEEPHCFEQVTVDDITLKVGDAVEVVAADGSTDGRWFWKLDKDVSINKSRELFFSSNCECQEPWPLENIVRK